VVQGDVGAADRRRAGAAVGLQHVAVEDDLLLAQHGEVAHGAEGAADEALDLLGATGLLALHRFPAHPLGARPRKQRVLGRDPALARPPQPPGHVVVHRRRAQHARLAHGHQHGAVGELRVVAVEPHRAQVVGLAPVLASQTSYSLFMTAASTGPWNWAAASATISSVDMVGQKWVSSSRPTPASVAARPAWRPLKCLDLPSKAAV